MRYLTQLVSGFFSILVLIVFHAPATSAQSCSPSVISSSEDALAALSACLDKGNSDKDFIKLSKRIETETKTRAENEKNPEIEVSNRIFLGSAANKKIRAGVVRILYTDERNIPSVCTGVLVGKPVYILTAGHCGCGNNYRLQAQSSSTLDNDILTPIGKPILFPSFQCGRKLDQQPGRDLALIKLELDDNTASIFERSGTYPKHLSMFEVQKQRKSALLIAGFGKTDGGGFPNHLRYGVARIQSYFCETGVIALSTCAMFREFILSNLPLTNGALSVDTCGGDSGGPVFLLGPKLDGSNKVERFLVGITSRAIKGVNQDRSLYCGGGGIYTAVGTAPVQKWLKQMGVESELSQNF